MRDYGQILPAENLRHRVEDVLLIAQEELAKSATTKCESLICQALLRPKSSKLKERLTSFTAECSQAAQKSWKVLVHCSILGLVEGALLEDDKKKP